MGTPTPPESVAARGHDLEWDPPWGNTTARRWTCRHYACGATVLNYNGNVYGSGTERDCTEKPSVA